jgi:hypothetical protein
MPAGSPTGGDNGDSTIILMVGAVVVTLVCLYLYHTHQILFDEIALDTAALLAEPFRFTKRAHYILQQIAMYPAAAWTPNEVASVWSALNRSYGRWVALFIGGLFTYWAWGKGLRFRYRTRHSIRSLLPLFAAETPALRPVMLIDGLKQPLDGGPWELPRTPLQWALQHGLILDRDGNSLPYEAFYEKSGLVREKARFKSDATLHPIGGYKKDGVRLDRDRAAALFSEQLAVELPADKALMEEDCSNFPPYLKALCAAAMAFGMGDKDTALEILNTMNLEWNPPVKETPGGWMWRGAPLRVVSVENLFTDVVSWMKLAEVHTKGEDLFAEAGSGVLNRAGDSTIIFKWWSFRMLAGKYTGRDVPTGRNGASRREYIWRWRLQTVWPLQPYRMPTAARAEVIPTCGDGELVEGVIERYREHEDVQDIFRQHGHWAGSFLYGSALFALKRGAFISPLFIWLRSVNSTAFHAFNQAGGATMWSKSAGISSHVDYEAVFGSKIDKPMVAPAVEALDEALKGEGWYD